MTRDYYAILGVSPTSEDVVIRAAYRALMRRYHPDADPSSEAAQRAQEINAAYAVLGNPEERSRYDGSLAAQGLIKPEAAPHRGLARRLVPGPAGMIGLAALLAAALFFAMSPPTGVHPKDALPLSAEPRAGRADQPALDPKPSDQRHVDDSDAVVPPRTVPASKEVPNAMLEPTEEFVATDVPEASAVRPPPAKPSGKRAATLTVAPKQATPKPAVGGEHPAVASAITPKADCRLGNGWADRAICNNGNLTALDRQNGLLYAQSWARADEGKRAALIGSRGSFQEKRDACRSENCLTNTYIARLREISDIMAQPSQH